MFTRLREGKDQEEGYKARTLSSLGYLFPSLPPTMEYPSHPLVHVNVVSAWPSSMSESLGNVGEDESPR